MNSNHLKTAWLLLLVVAGIVSMGSDSVAQIKVTETENSNGYVETIEMTVSPAAQPDPVFRHRLTWLPEDQVPGNAATIYMHSLGERPANIWGRLEKIYGDDVQSWAYYDTPRDQIPLDKLKQASSKFDDFVQGHMDRAARRRDCHWELGAEELTGPKIYGLLLNGLQETRSMAKAMQFQTKLAILESRFADAIDLMRMNYRLGENVGRANLLVASLIDSSIIGLTNGNMIDFISAPDSPNMYWALTELPNPIIDMRDAIRLECGFGMRIFPQMANPETVEHSVEEWARLFKAIPDEMTTPHEVEQPPSMKFFPMGIGLLSFTPAKKRLIESGMEAAKVEKMAVGQVLLIDMGREYRSMANWIEKEAYSPLYSAHQRSLKAEEFLEANSEFNAMDSFGKVLAGTLLPAIHSVRDIQIRSQRVIESLRVIEALRMHAAETGKFPAQLSDIRLVVVPNNPATGKPFEYRLEGDVAILDLPNSDGINKSRRYKLSLR